MTSRRARLSDEARRIRRALKARIPWVRRSDHEKLERRWLALVDVLAASPRHATTARIREVKPLARPLQGDACIFVTHAPAPELKPHVLAHVGRLLDAGFEVVLVANTDLPLDELRMEPALLGRLAAAYARENVGFDFAGWAHAAALCGDLSGCDRLLLANDSIVGPVDAAAYDRLLARLRASRADLVGLTWSDQPRPHLQSYFLCLSRRALAQPAVRELLAGIRILDTKRQVIDAYELSFTRRIADAGLTAEALFPVLGSDPRSADDTTHRWEQLLDAGFPFVKGSVLRSPRHASRARARIPAALLSP